MLTKCAFLLKIDLIFSGVKRKKFCLLFLNLILHLLNDLRAEPVKLALGKLILIKSVNGVRVSNINGADVTVTLADNLVRVATQQFLNGINAHLRGENSVTESGMTASYNMSKTGKLGLNTCLGLNLLRKGRSILRAKALGNNDDEATLAKLSRLLNSLTNIIIIMGKLGNNNGRCSKCNSGVKCDVTGSTTHNLNNVTSGMRLAGVTKLINKVDNSIHCGIKANGVVGGGNIVVDGCRNTDTRNALLG